ncbi:MAG: DeoR/GlpR transcriptional regulator [Anaerolineae bacterium]|nr:DeoR/GlpR transcriptional regulator [Anaerolineae bacterium]
MEKRATTARRRAEIIRQLEQSGAVQVDELESLWGVSAPTIRRDLRWVAAQGLARRVRGGAVAAGERVFSPAADPVFARIGRAAAALVQDGETIFLGPGPLAVEVARALAGRERLAIVTNSLAVARQVVEQGYHTLILTGGQLERQEQGLTGQLALAALENLRADRVFLELSGVSAMAGLTDDSLPQAEISRLLLEMGAQTIALVVPERVGRVAAVLIGPASDIETVVSAREADSASLWDLTEMGVNVVLA